MHEQHDVADPNLNNNPLRKMVQFKDTILIPTQSATSTSLLTSSSSSTSLTLPLIAEKTGARFKLLILLLGLFIALTIGFILSLLLVTQLNHHVPKHALSSQQFHSILSKQNITNNKNKNRLFEHLDSVWIDELDFNTDICYNFYGFVCRKWLTNHPLSPLDFKRSWLTERSQDIRQKFALTLANLSEIYAYNYQMEIKKNQTETTTKEMDIVDFEGLTSVKNELEQFYSFHDGYEDEHHKIVKRQIPSSQNNLSQSISNMFLYYNQCIHTSESLLLEELRQLAHDRFWFTNNYEITYTTNHLHFLFEQMIEHPLMHIWNINTINLGTQIIVHIQRKTQDQQTSFQTHYIEQASLFEHYVKKHHIDLCYQSSRVGPLANTLKEYKQLLTLSLSYTNSTISDDLHNLLAEKNSLPIIYSSVRHPNDLGDLIQFMLDKQMIDSLNDTHIYNLLVNFTRDLEQTLVNIPIFRSTISYQCQLYLNYYIQFRSLNNTKFDAWFDYISASIIHLIVHSWPGDASYICLYSTIVRHNQLEIIPYWNTFIQYTKKQIKDISSPIITVEIRLIDFFQLDSVFRFLFADQYAHYCNLMVYKYGPKLLPFVSVFHEGIQISLKSLWKQSVHEKSIEQINIQSLSLPFNHIPKDCLALLEYYYPFTLSSFYEEYMLNKTEELYSIAYQLRDHLILSNLNNQFLSSLQFHIKPERLKLFHDLFPTTTHIPYEYYFIENNYLSTAWNIIESSHEKLLQPTHEFFEINGYHTIKQGIFLQPTVAELYSNETTRIGALLLIAHELGHALCPCGINLTEREYFADLIALNLIINYQQEQLNLTTKQLNYIKTFFITYGQSECTHINREMISIMNNELHINRVLKGNEQFQTIFNCSLKQNKYAKKINSLLPEICTACREKKNELVS
ncbi:unnamed protein product [Adineta steineri]|uniref:Uncharacterized protein n=1 Tax=Adineta steineri TaxID=433720 RepID=A0A818J505_9BILA|nr:unnamed protein product [Adineta steineri]